MDAPLPPPSATLAARLRSARSARFVGRAAELEVFSRALATGHPSVLFVHGPGGIGKTALLQEFGACAQALGVTVVRLDGRFVEPSPAGFQAALSAALGESDPLAALGRGGRAALLLDTFERLAPLEDWMRDEMLPGLPGQTLVVVAGRQAPDPVWGADAGWRELCRAVPLRNLHPEESRAYLTRRGLPPERHTDLLGFTRGHPLALSLLADVLGQQGGDLPPLPQAVAGVIRRLVERFTSDVPSAAHRRALEACAQGRALNEAGLRAALGRDDVHDLFAWLRGLSFIEAGPRGVFPHDLVREVLDLDLRWRDPGGRAELQRRLRAHALRLIREGQEGEAPQAVFDLFFLHRQHPLLRGHYDWAGLESVDSGPARPPDHPALLAMIERHEGPEAAALARRWLARQPGAFRVARGPGGGEVLGVTALLSLAACTGDDEQADPAVAAAWRFMRAHGPPREGEDAVLVRFLLDRDGYQRTSRVLNHLGLGCSLRWLTDPRLSWMFFAAADPAYYEAYMTHYDYRREPEADFEVGGRAYGVYAHDWRRVTGAQWLERVGEGALAAPLTAEASPPEAELLSRPDFEAAVKAALRDFHRPEALRANPLARSRLVRERRGRDSGDEGQILRAALHDAAQRLQARPRDEKFYRALRATYLDPARTQEDAAERLGLPFGTYRYQLAGGIERVTARLWQLELGG